MAARPPGPTAGRAPAGGRAAPPVPAARPPPGPRAFAVLPSGSAQRLPGGLLEHPLPTPGLSLWAHPHLPRAVVGDTSACVLVLGEPVDVPGGLDGATPVAQLLHRLLADGPGLAAATERAAVLCGSWAVLLAGPEGGRALTDPLPSWDLRLAAQGTALVSDPALLAALGGGEGAAVGGDRLVRTTGPGPGARWQPDPLPDLAGPAAASGTDVAHRLGDHVRLLARRGRPVLGLGGGAGLLQLLPLLAGSAEGDGRAPARPGAVTWWDPADTDSTLAMMRGGDLAFRAGVDQRLVLTGGAGPAGLAEALRPALDADEALWLGARPGDPEEAHPLLRELPPTLPVALPWSDRLLPLLPGSTGPGIPPGRTPPALE